jgi:hypothetical protein
MAVDNPHNPYYMAIYLRELQMDTSRSRQGAARSSGRVAESTQPFSTSAGTASAESNEALREAGARAAELAGNPVARSMLAAGLVTAAAALTANARVRKTVRDAGGGALDTAEAASDSAAKIGAAMVTAATDAVKRLLQSEPSESAGAEISQGRALGVPLSHEEGMARLESYARPHPIESWAGPVLGAGGLEERLGIARSTLNDWRRRGAVIGILRGERKHYFPVEQFVDGRPMVGIGAVSRIVGDPKAAWLWLRQAHGWFDMATPLEALKDGGVEAVVDAARRDFS